MSKLWILIADSTKARIFTTESERSPLVELDGLSQADVNVGSDNLSSAGIDSSGDDLSGHGRHDLEPSAS